MGVEPPDWSSAAMKPFPFFVVFLIMAYGGMMTMVDPDAKFVADDALLRALLEN